MYGVLLETQGVTDTHTHTHTHKERTDAKRPAKSTGAPQWAPADWAGEAAPEGSAGASIGKSPQRVSGRCDWLPLLEIPSWFSFFFF